MQTQECVLTANPQVCGCPELHDVVLDFPLRKPWSGHLGTAALTTLAPVDVGARDTQLEQVG